MSKATSRRGAERVARTVSDDGATDDLPRRRDGVVMRQRVQHDPQPGDDGLAGRTRAGKMDIYLGADRGREGVFCIV